MKKVFKSQNIRILMKIRGAGKIIFCFFSIILLSCFASAGACELVPTMISQDPYPAVPNEYVKIVFQLNGTENPECGKVFFDVSPEYPFSLDANSSKIVMHGGNFITDYPPYLIAAYKLRVDKNALDGENNLKVIYGSEGGGKLVFSKQFPVEIEDERTDFDVIISSYDAAKNSVTFAIVNIGKKNVEALTLEIPKQTNIEVMGSNKVIIGSLNSNDDTTTSIQAVPKEGEIVVKLDYNDRIGVRRSVEKTVYFGNGQLLASQNVAQPRSGYFYLFWLLVIILVVYMVYRYYKNKNAKNSKLASLRR